MDRLTEERIAHNDHVFRVANEQIGAAAAEQGLELGVPFICECADAGCTALVRLPPSAYRTLREHPRRFLVARGHESADLGTATVVDRADGYNVVEKRGHAGEVAERLAQEDPA